MICQQCGHTSAAMSTFCANCGQPQQSQAATAACVSGARPMGRLVDGRTGFATAVSVAKSTDAHVHASFLGRFAAFVVDDFLAGLLAGVTYLVTSAMAVATGASTL